MAATGISFRWLDILEKEFDKAFVDLDILLSDFDSEEPDLLFNARQKISTLSSCFAQLTHKAQTIFQNNAKIEAELVHLRAELIEAKALLKTLGPDVNFKFKRGAKEDGTTYSLLETAALRTEATQLRRENTALRNSLLALQSEVYGAKLAAKYLDKELAGRIQQLQLLGREMRGDVRDGLWRQLEAEILLHRHKTVVRACRGPPRQHAAPPAPSSHGQPRLINVTREKGEGLGISITGGREHGVPILISELEPQGPAARTGQLYVGDAILWVNGQDLTQACHQEAVHALSKQTGDIALQVQYVANEDSDPEDSLGDDIYAFRYRFFDDEVLDGSEPIRLHRLHTGLEFSTNDNNNGACISTPTAPRTPESTELNSRNASPDPNDDDNPMAVRSESCLSSSPDLDEVTRVVSSDCGDNKESKMMAEASVTSEAASPMMISTDERSISSESLTKSPAFNINTVGISTLQQIFRSVTPESTPSPVLIPPVHTPTMSPKKTVDKQPIIQTNTINKLNNNNNNSPPLSYPSTNHLPLKYPLRFTEKRIGRAQRLVAVSSNSSFDEESNSRSKSRRIIAHLKKPEVLAVGSSPTKDKLIESCADPDFGTPV